MFKPQYSCNQCGTPKLETNHWLAIRIATDCSQIYNRLEVRAFDDSTVNDEHYCGLTCISKRVSQFIEGLQNRVGIVKSDSFDEEINDERNGEKGYL